MRQRESSKNRFAKILQQTHVAWYGPVACLKTGLVLILSLFSATTHARSGASPRSPNTRTYEVYVPKKVKDGSIKSAPALVLLHGCSQSAATIAAATEMNDWADKKGFVVIYPQQSWRDNFQKCWNWFATENLARAGEAEMIANLTQQVIQTYSLDRSRIFVAGLSAGAAMTSNLLACYSDLFAGGAVASGLAYDAAEGMTEAFRAMRSGALHSAEEAALKAYACAPKRSAPIHVIVLHGDRDRTVNDRNAAQTIAFFDKLNDLIDDGTLNNSLNLISVSHPIPAPSRNGLEATELDQTSDGQVITRLITVHGMDHAWSGGRKGESYTEPDGPSASQLIVEDFFGP